VDAREVLGIPLNAGEEEIRAAYVQKVKEHPPDRSPEQFEKIRDAYETLRDPRRRMRDMLLSADPEASLATLIAGEANERRFAGPQPWLDVLKPDVKKGGGPC
jgi:curved DNA-binding protein CbpA